MSASWRVRLGMAIVMALVACGGEEGRPAPGPDYPEFPDRDWEAEAAVLADGPDWYRHAVFYEVFVRSLQDSDGDGIGDLPGLTSRLDELKALGVDALWLMPIMPTPFFDSGYDVADYEAINPDYGSLDDFDALLDAAHERGMRVLIDLVLNHTSNQHAWFESSRSDPSGPHGDFYVWSDTPSDPGNGCDVHQPIFGDSPWTFDETRQQYYFHRFYPEQPDLDYESPAVVDATLDVARFWLDRGVDGFRCDVIALLHESADDCGFLEPTKQYVRQLRDVVDEYDGAVLLAEPTEFENTPPYYGDGTDMFHMTFNFAYGYFWSFHFGSKDAAKIATSFDRALNDHPAEAQEALVIGSHDVPRAYNAALGGEALQRRAAFVQMTMRGTPFIYYGEELALRPGTEVVVDNRDSARTPLPWTADAPGYAFTDDEPWIAFGPEVAATNVASESEDPDSMYGFYRELLRQRNGRAVFGTGDVTILQSDNQRVLAYRRDDAELTYLALVNLGDEPETATLSGADLPNVGLPVLGAAEVSLEGADATVSLEGAGYALLRHR